MMENMSERDANYVEEVSCLVAFISGEDWVLNIDEESVNDLFRRASEIEEMFSNENMSNLCETLKGLFPFYNLENLGSTILETFLVNPDLSEKMLLCAVHEFLSFFSLSRLYDLVMHLMRTQRLREEFIYLIHELKNDDLLTMLEARSLLYFWEKMIYENNENFEKCVIDCFENETSLFLECVRLSAKNIGNLLLCIIIRYLSIKNDLKMWFILLNNRNIATTFYLCGEFPEFLDAFLAFLARYASVSEAHVGRSFSWSNNYYPLNIFVENLNFILVNDGIVGVTVNDFINYQIYSFGKSHSFWLDVKALL